MKRVRIGDVFACPLTKGYGFIQLAHKERNLPEYKGAEYIRVLPGIFPTTNIDIPSIVNQQETISFMFYITRLLNKGCVEYLGNFPLPDGYELPRFWANFAVSENTRSNGRLVGKWDIQQTMITDHSDPSSRIPIRFYGIDDIDIVSAEYRTTLANLCPDPYGLFYMIENGASLHRWESLWIPLESMDKYMAALNYRLESCYM